MQDMTDYEEMVGYIGAFVAVILKNNLQVQVREVEGRVVFYVSRYATGDQITHMIGIDIVSFMKCAECAGKHDAEAIIELL